MRLNCFRAGNASTPYFESDIAPRLARTPDATTGDNKRRSYRIRRYGSSESNSSNASSLSNDSISRLPVCAPYSPHKLASILMPIPPELQPSRCLRLSQPKTYSAIVDGMKSEKGCRDWRNFAVFHCDDIDKSLSANEIAQKRAADCERKLQRMNNTSCQAEHPVEFG